MPSLLRSLAVAVLLPASCRSWAGPQRVPHRTRRLSSQSKPMPDEAVPVADPLLPDEELVDDVAEPPPREEPPEDDGLEDIRERIRRRAAEMNLQESMATPDEYDGKNQGNVLEQMVQQSMDDEELNRKAAQFADGRNLLEGVLNEISLLKWPPWKETLDNFLVVVGLAVFICLFVTLVDEALYAYLPLTHPVRIAQFRF